MDTFESAQLDARYNQGACPGDASERGGEKSRDV